MIVHVDADFGTRIRAKQRGGCSQDDPCRYFVLDALCGGPERASSAAFRQPTYRCKHSPALRTTRRCTESPVQSPGAAIHGPLRLALGGPAGQIRPLHPPRGGRRGPPRWAGAAEVGGPPAAGTTAAGAGTTGRRDHRPPRALSAWPKPRSDRWRDQSVTQRPVTRSI